MAGWNVQIEMFQIRQEQDMTMLMTFLEGQVFDNDMVRIVLLYLYSGWICLSHRLLCQTSEIDFFKILV